MPLIIVTGLPCSGKTFRARQIQHEFESRIEAQSQAQPKRTVVFLPSHHASLDLGEGDTPYTAPTQTANPRDEIYNSAKAEKTARAEEFSAIKRALSKNAVVISDAANYIKGFRYQLWCEAKAAGTRCVVVHAAAREDECEAWNNARIVARGWKYPEAQDTQETSRSQMTGPKIGRDVRGDLMPESHTAIYGDKILNESAGTRSRSSSMGAASSSDEHEPRQSIDDDTKTLKSLYITHPASNTPTPPTPSPAPTTTEQPLYALPPAQPPHPLSSLPYSPQTQTSLSMRYEPPSPFTRWDTPLFTIPTDDAHPPYSQIWAALFPESSAPLTKKQLSSLRREEQAAAEAKARKDQEQVKQHAATVLPQATGANALQLLEGTTGEVAKEVLRAARDSGVDVAGSGGEIELRFAGQGQGGGEADADADAGALVVPLDVPEGVALSQPVLQRLRRKYTQIQRGGIAHGQGYVTGRREIIEGFIQFLEAEWEGS